METSIFEFHQFASVQFDGLLVSIGPVQIIQYDLDACKQAAQRLAAQTPATIQLLCRVAIIERDLNHPKDEKTAATPTDALSEGLGFGRTARVMLNVDDLGNPLAVTQAAVHVGRDLRAKGDQLLVHPHKSGAQAQNAWSDAIDGVKLASCECQTFCTGGT